MGISDGRLVCPHWWENSNKTAICLLPWLSRPMVETASISKVPEGVRGQQAQPLHVYPQSQWQDRRGSSHLDSSHCSAQVSQEPRVTLKVDGHAAADICWADHPWNLALRHTEAPTSHQGENKQPHRGKPRPNTQTGNGRADNTQERLPSYPAEAGR